MHCKKWSLKFLQKYFVGGSAVAFKQCRNGAFFGSLAKYASIDIVCTRNVPHIIRIVRVSNYALPSNVALQSEQLSITICASPLKSNRLFCDA